MKKINIIFLGIVLGFTLNISPTFAGYIRANGFTLLPTAWDPGLDTARVAAGNPAPGGASWSLMAAGILADAVDPHLDNSTTDFLALLGQTSTQASAFINSILDIWDDDSAFTNLGEVDDGGSSFGASNGAGGHLGDIRIGAIFIDGNVGSNVLAHAYQPCTNALCVPGGSIGGDMHIDDTENWGDGTRGTFDLFTVMLHEFGHSLGLDHSDVLGSVMEPIYAGARRSLHSDDINGIQAIYGASTSTVPEPSALILLLSGLSAIGFFGRRRKSIT
ncbi:MAG: matrixin family metalloprotease [Methyloprofundus sp.]|nr:matrixin family metalloprotease [Methyloprofundus sp.]